VARRPVFRENPDKEVARVANLRTEPENLRTSEPQMQRMQAERLTKNHEHGPDIQAARRFLGSIIGGNRKTPDWLTGGADSAF